MGDVIRMERERGANTRRAPAAQALRVLAVDLMRGLAVMGMVMVAYAGGWEHRFTFLTHADWRGFAAMAVAPVPK